MASETRGEVLKLMEKKEKIEHEIRELSQILTENGVELDTPLVDNEGYPLPNIDIYQIRFVRNKIACLQNDHKAVMQEIEKNLATYYANCLNDSPAQHGSPDYSTMANFARVSNIASGSPAEEAGLQENDLIFEFGSANANNYKDIGTIAQIVRFAEDSEVTVKVRRDSRIVSTRLRPRRWPGRGLIGCLITTLDIVDR